MRPAYPEAILHAGGIPVVLPLTSEETVLQQLTAAFDAFLFTGGPDLHPFYFHEEAHARCGNISPKRDSMELLLLKLATVSYTHLDVYKRQSVYCSGAAQPTVP